MEYTIADGLTINKNAVKVAILNGSRIIGRAIDQGKLKAVTGNKDATVKRLRSLVSNQLKTAMETVSGDHPDKDTLLVTLELYLIDQMMNHA